MFLLHGFSQEMLRPPSKSTSLFIFHLLARYDGSESPEFPAPAPSLPGHHTPDTFPVLKIFKKCRRSLSSAPYLVARGAYSAPQPPCYVNIISVLA